MFAFFDEGQPVVQNLADLGICVALLAAAVVACFIGLYVVAWLNEHLDTVFGILVVIGGVFVVICLGVGLATDPLAVMRNVAFFVVAGIAVLGLLLILSGV